MLSDFPNLESLICDFLRGPNRRHSQCSLRLSDLMVLLRIITGSFVIVETERKLVRIKAAQLQANQQLIKEPEA